MGRTLDKLSEVEEAVDGLEAKVDATNAKLDALLALLTDETDTPITDGSAGTVLALLRGISSNTAGS